LNTRELLAQADLAPLLASFVQLSGEEDLLGRCRPFITGAWSFNEAVPQALRDELLDRLSACLAAIQSGSRPPAPTPDSTRLRAIMETCIGQRVPDEYLPLITHEMGLAGSNGLEVEWRQAPDPVRLEQFRVLVIGAGESGLCAAIKLKRLGISFDLIEKNDRVGGTWLENQYPGCGVDTPNHFYQYSFEPNHDWTRYFSPRDEIQAYLERCADRYGLRPHIRFGREVTHLTWDENGHFWRAQIRDRQGGCVEVQAQAVICAIGQLNRPKYPDLAGLDRFSGAAMHTARWDSRVNLDGKRVAMIGTGASGMQVGPSIIDRVAQLTIFQRSPHWAVHNPLYHSEVKPGKQWALHHLPHYARWYRFQLFWASGDGLYSSLQVDPDWPTPNLSLNAENHAMRERLIAHISAEVGHDPTLLAKAVPTYPPYGKRMLRDNHWFRMLTNPKAKLVTEPIGSVAETAVLTTDGMRHEADVLILATGFQADRMTWPMVVTGRRGQTLRDRWGEDDPRAYLGITVPDFPNFFMMYGPNTNLAHGGSAIFHSECQTRYALLALRDLIEGGSRSMDCRPEVHDRFNELVDAKHAGMVWAHRGVGSWYKNRRGRVFATSPWRLVDYWNMTRRFEPGDYRID
jgi:4-hydroxyacetophenone monooxygenase